MCSWKEAATSYMEAGQLALQDMQSGCVAEDSLSEVQRCREVLDKADNNYTAVLDHLDTEEKKLKCMGLRRQRLEINWRQVFGVDLRQLVSPGCARCAVPRAWTPHWGVVVLTVLRCSNKHAASILTQAAVLC